MKTTNPRIPIQLHNDVMTNLRYYLKLASHYYHQQINEPLITYRNKGSIAGSAHLQKWQIQLNTLMLLEHQNEFIQQTVPHELAHLIAHQQFGRVSPHGKEWQFIMRDIFSVTPERTHHFQIPKQIIRNTYSYQCDCQTHQLSTIRHNRIQNHLAIYCCKKCGTKLYYQ